MLLLSREDLHNHVRLISTAYELKATSVGELALQISHGVPNLVIDEAGSRILPPEDKQTDDVLSGCQV